MNIITLFRLTVLFEILLGAHAWFTWWVSNSHTTQYAVYIITAYIAYKYKKKMKIRISSSPYLLYAFLSYIIAVMFFNRMSLPSLVGVAFTLYPLAILVSDTENSKGHLQFICKGLAIILIPGIILFLCKGFIPQFGPVIQKGSSEDYIFINQLFLIRRIGGFDSEAANRFHSVFLEPGYLGSMLSFIMFAVKYDLSKWYTRALLVAQLVSLSLAGYVLTFIGYVLYIISEGRSMKKIMILAILIPIVYIIAINYNNGNNYINNAIVSRLQYDEEKGITGNNRTGAGTEFYYEQAMKNGEIWMGLGMEKVKQINGGSSDSAGYSDNIRGAGYKVFFVTRGVLCSIFFLMFYIFIAHVCCKKRAIKFAAIILLIVTFIPQSTPLSTAWIYPFVLGLLFYNQKKTAI